MLMQLNRDLVYVSTQGPSIEFKKDVPTYVPAKLVPDIVGLGGVAAETDKQGVADTMELVAKARIEADARIPKIEEALREMAKRNQRGDFTAGAEPNLVTLGKMINDTVTRAEVTPLWEKVKAEIQ